jgi:hypothetical protein
MDRRPSLSACEGMDVNGEPVRGRTLPTKAVASAVVCGTDGCSVLPCKGYNIVSSVSGTV